MKRFKFCIDEMLEHDIAVVVKQNPQLWHNKTHFVKSALIRQLNSFKRGEIR